MYSTGFWSAVWSWSGWSPTNTYSAQWKWRSSQMDCLFAVIPQMVFTRVDMSSVGRAPLQQIHGWIAKEIRKKKLQLLFFTLVSHGVVYVWDQMLKNEGEVLLLEGVAGSRGLLWSTSCHCLGEKMDPELQDWNCYTWWAKNKVDNQGGGREEGREARCNKPKLTVREASVWIIRRVMKINFFIKIYMFRS